ncbi:MAG: sulfite exporter TauE/SafE family protein [Clostridia bacterium]|nr:sulfite exporter TauE/SafE family protein [Clostridia bacterium]
MKKKFVMKNGIIGFVAGVVSGLFASGGGLILVPAFVFFNKMNEKRSRGTSIFCILFLVLASSFIYYKENFIDWNIGIKCAIGGIIGGIIGSILLKRLDEKILKIIFIFFLGYVGIRMLIS